MSADLRTWFHVSHNISRFSPAAGSFLAPTDLSTNLPQLAVYSATEDILYMLHARPPLIHEPEAWPATPNFPAAAVQPVLDYEEGLWKNAKDKIVDIETLQEKTTTLSNVSK